MNASSVADVNEAWRSATVAQWEALDAAIRLVPRVAPDVVYRDLDEELRGDFLDVARDLVSPADERFSIGRGEPRPFAAETVDALRGWLRSTRVGDTAAE